MKVNLIKKYESDTACRMLFEFVKISLHKIQKYPKNLITMIQKKISTIKQLITMKIEIEAEKLETINNIENLLNKLDFNSEEVPINNVERLLNLLTSLKGESLNLQEKELIKEISAI